MISCKKIGLAAIVVLAVMCFEEVRSCPCHNRRAATIQSNPTNQTVAIVAVMNGIRATNRLVVRVKTISVYMHSIIAAIVEAITVNYIHLIWFYI